MDENGKKNIKSNNKKIIILFMLIPIILIVEVLCFTGYRNYVSKRNADNNSKESYNEKKENIKKVYDQAAQVFDFSIDHNSCIGIEIFEYKHYLVGDMLAVVLTTKYRSCAVTIPKYYIYVINVKKGRKVNLDEILEYKNINKDYFNEKVKNGIINSYYSSFDDSKYYDYLIDENLKTYENDTNKKFFIYDNGNINLLISITIHPVKIEEIFKIITIE